MAVEGNQLVVLDLRIAEYLASGENSRLPPTIAEYIEAHGDKIVEAAAIGNVHSVPAIRAVLGEDFSPPEHGAGGRMVTVITEMRAGGGIGTADLSEIRPWASGMMVSFANVGITRRVAGLAETLIHEQAHLADLVLKEYRDAPVGIGWYSEAVASFVADVAARMDAGSVQQADPDASRISSRMSSLQDNTATYSSPWGQIDGRLGSSSPAQYDRGGRIIRYAQQLIADDGNPVTLHERLRAKAPDNGTLNTIEEYLEPWSINAIAAEVGLTPEELLEQSMIADLTDDIIPAEAVERFAVAQVDVRRVRRGCDSRGAVFCRRTCPVFAKRDRMGCQSVKSGQTC